MIQLIIALFSLCFLSDITLAADIKRINDLSVRCVLELNGRIQAGDARKIQLEISKLAEEYSPSQSINGIVYSHMGVMFEEDSKVWFGENAARLCLNSEGGSFDEALKIAALINHSTYGTVIRRNHSCLSACALIFLAGSFVNEGESIVIDRHMHATARLGFHAPSLPLEKGSYLDWKMVTDAYEVAVASMAAIQAKTSVLNMRNSLLFHMLSTPPSQIFFVDTVGKALRWKISVFGTKTLEKLANQNRLFICDAALAQYAENDGSYGFPDMEYNGSKPDPNAHPISLNRKNSNGIIVFSGKNTGYLGEAASDCVFEYSILKSKIIYRPGHTQSTVVFVPDNIKITLPSYSVYAPDTLLKNVARDSDNSFASSSGICSVRKEQKVVDKETCSKFTKSQIEIYVWPSGAKTVIQTIAEKRKINGNSGRIIPSNTSEQCTLNSKTRNIFCFKEN